MASIIDEVIEAGKLPTDADDVLDFFVNPDGSFITQEGVNWDFKEKWPLSYSDSYFAGLARLVCAFGNTDGGLIVFGVQDDNRLPVLKRSEPLPNLDQFEKALDQLIGFKLSIDHRRYLIDGEKCVDVVMVRRRPSDESPVRFKQSLHGYRKDVIWVRSRHEVREAQAGDIPKLYIGSKGDSLGPTVSVSLPPSPATVREFIGRMDCIDRLFRWLKQSDQPRHFLFGKGGSGKSTIAFEIVKALKSNPKNFRIEGADIVEQIIYVSAKKQYLDLDKLTNEDFAQNDFSSEKTLYFAILTLGGFDFDHEKSDDLHYLRDKIRNFFGENSCILVIDDIDTLTTAGLETGMDFLEGVLWRSNKRSKILYTLRNRPSHSVASSIEVPGLPDKEYEAFIIACCDQFNVPVPSTEFSQTQLAELSERRPLVIESVIALRRHCSNYTNAIDAFLQSSGDNVRKYVFEREWNALPVADKSREILAILACHGKPMAFTDLCIVSRMNPSRVSDAISQIQEMFLVVEQDGDESRFYLGDLTKLFISQASKKLDFYETIQARVSAFKSSFYADSPVINKLTSELDRAVYFSKQGDPKPLEMYWHDLRHGEYNPKIAEDPRFLVLRAVSGLLVNANNIDTSRNDFEVAFSLNSSPELDYVRLWFDAEKLTDMSEVQTQKILNFVLKNKGYGTRDKAEFHVKRGIYLYNFARNNIHMDYFNSTNKLKVAIEHHLKALYMYRNVSGYNIDKTWEYCRNTAFYLALNLSKARDSEQFVAMLSDLVNKSKGLHVDPLGEPTLFLFRRAASSPVITLGDMHKLKNDLRRARHHLNANELWYEKGEQGFFIEEYNKLSKMIDEKINKSKN